MCHCRMVIDIKMGVSSVLIIDAMCVVNMVTKTLEMTNAMHFAKKFVAIVAEMSKTNYEEIRIVLSIRVKFSERNY